MKAAKSRPAASMAPEAAAFATRAADQVNSISAATALPCNAALQHEAAAFLAQERAAEASSILAAAAQKSAQQGSISGRANAGTSASLTDVDGVGERVPYPLTSPTTEKINPCTCSTTIFDGWLRAVVVSIPGPSDAVSPLHNSHVSVSGVYHAAVRGGGGQGHASSPASGTAPLTATVVSREHALYAALELLEAAARLLQRRLTLSRGQNRLLQAYYNALEEDIDRPTPPSATAAAAAAGSELKPTDFHRELRARKRAAPLQHYAGEQAEVEARLDKVYYVLRKLEEVEGLGNSVLVEGREAAHHSAAAGGAGSSTSNTDLDDDSNSDSDDDDAVSSGEEGDEVKNGKHHDGAETDSPSPATRGGGTASRRLVAMERRVRRMRRQLRLPLQPAEITSRLRNELILSFSARVLALREPAPFTAETSARVLRPATSPSSPTSPPFSSSSPPAAQDRHKHSISAFVEWYVQHVLDPPAMSQLLSIVPHEYVVTTSCRLVYACEAHASLRASRALPDLGAVLLRAVTEGRADAVAQLVLSSSVSYGSALAHPVHSPTCFYAGLFGGQLEVVGRLVDQQCWDTEALHVMLFAGAPWSRASTTHGCYAYQKAMLDRVWRVLQLAERALRATARDSGDGSGVAGDVSRADSYEADEQDVDEAAEDSQEKEKSTTAAVAVAALRDAHLLTTTTSGTAAEGLSVLEGVLGVLNATPFVPGTAGHLAHGEASTSDDFSAAATTSEMRHLLSGWMSGTLFPRTASLPPPAFLDGGLQRLRLLLAARNATLQYERHQQDAQWETLLRQTTTTTTTTTTAAAPSSSPAQKGKSTPRGAAAAAAAPQHRDDAGTVAEDESESTLATVLQHQQLDALSPAAVAPLRCHLCPAYSTPMLQRVDELSYGPLQPTVTTTLTAAAAAAAAGEGGDGASGGPNTFASAAVEDGRGFVSSNDDDDEDEAENDDNSDGEHENSSARGGAAGRTTRGAKKRRPVRALLLCADTAIEAVADSWHAYWCPPVAPASPATAAETTKGVVAGLATPWTTSAGRWQANTPFRYSAVEAVEERLYAAQAAKQRRARRVLYGTSADETIIATAAAGGAPDSDDRDAESVAAGRLGSIVPRPLSSSGGALATTITTTARGASQQAARSTYFETRLSLNYLLALHDPASAICEPGADLASGQSQSVNGVVVGLCDDVVAATANGCTRGPHQPHPVTHLGHAGDPTCAPAQQAEVAMRSAGVSVTVVARCPKTLHAAPAVEVVYVALEQHRYNVAEPITSAQASRLYLRLEVAQYAVDLKAHSDEDESDGEEDAFADFRHDNDREKYNENPSGDASSLPLQLLLTSAFTFVPTVTVATPQEVQEAQLRAHQSSAPLNPEMTPLRATYPATIVLGLLYTPTSDTLRLRVNNYVHPDELTMGLMAAATASGDASQFVRELPARLYPAATLSLDEHGWERWYTHQTAMWTRARQRRSNAAHLSAGAGTAAHAPSGVPGGGSSAASAQPLDQAVSNAVIRFAFDAADLYYGPPLPASTFAPGKASKAARRPRGEYVGLLDTACKFTQMLRVLTNVSALAGLTSAQQRVPPSGPSAGLESNASMDVTPPGFSEGGLLKGRSGAIATPFFGSRDRHLRDALARVQRLLNAPAAEGVLFYPPVRIYRHSSHCPQQELYPLTPTAPAAEQKDTASAKEEGGGDARRSSGVATGASASSPPMRRQLGAGLGAPASLNSASAHLYWHELISENARLNPLCAALASRQPALAYAISIHPLTSFCDGGNESHNRLQQQQRRTALYAACALGYADVLAVLLERIPVEELLSYFGLIIEGEARAALQQSYTKTEALFLRNYRLHTLSASPTTAATTIAALALRDAVKSGGSGAVRGSSGRPMPARAYSTNECQRPLLDVSSIYSTTRSLYTPLHVAMLGVLHDGDDDLLDDDQYEASAEITAADRQTHDGGAAPSSPPPVRGLGRQTACATLLLNCLYDLLLVAGVTVPSGTTVTRSRAEDTDAATAEASRPSSPAQQEWFRRPLNSVGAELLVSALNLQSRAGETALLLAVRHNNCRIATRLLRLGAQAACMDRVTHLFTLELACANRCSPMAEALLSVPGSPFATSPVLLNHAGIATALCWCAINNMHAVLQMLLRCDGVDVSAGFEGSSPLHLAITFGSEEAALALLSATQPKSAASPDGTSRPGTQRAKTTEKDLRQPQKPYMDVNVPHERTHCTPLHLACERGQLQVIRALLQSWHAQLNIPAAHTNYTPLLTALANGREDAALRVLEYSKDELRRGRAVLDLAAIDQNGDTALHLAARRGLVIAMEYMLVQFCEEEVTRLAQLHPQLRTSPAFMTATCMVPLHAVNKQGKSALLVAIQYDQADAAEVLVSTVMDHQDEDDSEAAPDEQERVEARQGQTSSAPSTTSGTATTTTATTSTSASLFGGPLIDGTCMALHQAFKKRLYTVVDLMLSTPSSARFFPCSAAFRTGVQRHTEERRGGRARLAQILQNDNDDDGGNSAAAAKTRAAQQNRSSFVRLLLTRAAGPTISPSGALHVLFGGFVLPELCVYLSDVAAESAVLGVQHGAAMAHAELLMGYLQEHAGLVVAPTRMVGFCRDVWNCLQSWMLGKAAASQKEVPVKKRPGNVNFRGGQSWGGATNTTTTTASRCDTASPSAASRKRLIKEEADSAVESPMMWLCRVLLLSAAVVPGTRPRGPAARQTSASASAARGPAAADAERDRVREQEARRIGESLRSALNRKSLSLDVARVIRLYGSSAGGARAMEEIEGLVRAFVTAKANARARQMRRRPTNTNANAKAQLSKQTAEEKAEAEDEEHADHDNGKDDGDDDGDSASTVESSMTSAAAIIASSEADVYKEVIGNEELFTTPTGFTVLQLAAALGLSEVTAFLVNTYQLDPLYVPAQDLYTAAEADAVATKNNERLAHNPLSESGDTRASVVASASSPLFASLNAAVAAAVTATTGREEEEDNVRVLNSYTVRAMSRLAGGGSGANGASAALHGSSGSGVDASGRASGRSGGGDDDGAGQASDVGSNSTWFYWTPYRLAVRTGNVEVVRTLLKTGAKTPSMPMTKKKSAARMDRQRGRENQQSGAKSDGSNNTAAVPHVSSRIVDFKEPRWVDPFQRTALQERIVVVAASAAATTPGTSSSVTGRGRGSSHGGAGGNNNNNASASFDDPVASAADTRSRSGQTAAAAADMIALLLRYGAQPNGLFDSTGSDAWMLALTGGSGDASGLVRGGPDSAASAAAASAGRAAASSSSGSGVEHCLNLLLRCRTPLLGHAPDVGAAKDAAAAPSRSADEALDEQLLQHSRTLLRQWKRLVSLRDTSSSSSSSGLAREKFVTMKRQHVAAAADMDLDALDSVDEGGFVFEVAEALSEVYREGVPDTAAMPLSRGASPRPDELFVDDLQQPSLAALLTFKQADADSPGAVKVFSPTEQTIMSSLLSPRDDHPLSDGVTATAMNTATAAAQSATYREKLLALLRLCYRVVLLFLCVDHAPQQLLRLVHVYTLAMVPLRARHPFSGDTVVSRLLRKARERLLTSGATPTEHEVDDMMSRVIDGVSRADLSRVAATQDPNTVAAAAEGAASTMAALDSRQRVYRDPTEDAGAAVLIRTTLTLIHVLPRLCNAAEPSDCALLQFVLFQPSFDEETALSIAARLAYVPLISAIVQSAASPAMLDAIEATKIDWTSKRSSRFVSRRPSQALTGVADEDGAKSSALSSADGIAAAASSTSSSSVAAPAFSLFTNLADVAVRVLLGTRVYYPAHEIVTVRILLHCMPDEATQILFLRWVYPNIHPLPALQLAMDHVDVAAQFLTGADCMNALWTNLLYAHFTRQLDTAVQASSKAWNALLKVVLPGAPAVPIYLVLRGALQTKPDDAEAKSTGLETRTMSAASLRSTGSTLKRKSSQHRQKKAELTNWSYLVRRTTIFLQLMSMSVAESLAGKTAANAAPGSSTTTTTTANANTAAVGAAGGAAGRGASRAASRANSADGADGATAAAASSAAAGAASGATTTTTTTRGLAGTLLLDTLELAVRFDDKEVLNLLMQLQLPEVVIRYIQQVQLQQQQQHATSASTFPVSITAQNANARAIEAAAAAIANSYPSFTSVRTMTQASVMLDRLQRLLWREAVQERHLDLIAVLAGAGRTLRFLYTTRQADVALLMTPMRYDRIDVRSGNPEGVVNALPSQQQQQQRQLSPGLDASVSVMAAAHQAEHPNGAAGAASAVVSKLGRRSPATPSPATSPFDKTPFSATARSSPSPPPPPKGTPRSQAQKQEAEEESRFAESCLQNGRLAGREERRRRVTTVTWGIGGSALPIDLQNAQTGSVSIAVAPSSKSNSMVEMVDEEEENAAATLNALTGEEKKSVVTPPQQPLSPVPPPLPPAPLVASNAVSARNTVHVPATRTRTTATAAAASGVAKQTTTTRNSTSTSSTRRTAPPLVPTLQLPPSPSPAATPRVVRNPVYFMYLQLDWAMFSTRLLQSPQPSTATVDTILYLLEHRSALSVPVLDLFLSGLSVPAAQLCGDEATTASPSSSCGGGPNGRGGDTRRPHSSLFASQADAASVAADTVELSLRYQTRHHRDTLLHLLVLHDQCQLAEYYLEYCFFYCVSHQLDPEPKNGRPGRFPIHEAHDGSPAAGTEMGLSGRVDRHSGKRRSGALNSNSNNNNNNSGPLDNMPVEFLRLMLRVNAHGLTAFDYAHSPAMLQLLQWYGCVPPTYRPNPRLFRQVLTTTNAAGGGGGADGRGESAGWVFVGDDEQDKQGNTFANGGGGLGRDNAGARKGPGSNSNVDSLHGWATRREPLYFFPVPRLVLASDNFVTLLDPTGTELATTAASSSANTATSLTATTLAARGSTLSPDGTSANDGGTAEGNNTHASSAGLQDQSGERRQLKANKHVTALMAAERKQFLQLQRRREQQERAKAMLYEQVAVQPLLTVSHGGDKGAKSTGESAVVAKATDAAASASGAQPRRRGPANPPYLTRAVTANLRERWDAQRHPHVSDNVLWHNALEAQRSSSSLAASRLSSSGGGRGGVLPILLSEEVSLLHLGLCTFDDELVSLYGELHASPLQFLSTQGTFSNIQHGGDSSSATRGTGGKGSGGSGAGQRQQPTQTPLSAYNRMLLPPVLTGRAAQQRDQQQQQQQADTAKNADAAKQKTTASPANGGPAPPQQPSGISGSHNTRASSVLHAVAPPPPPPPRLSQTDVIFLLECQQFVVFPLALPSIVDDFDEETFADSAMATDAGRKFSARGSTVSSTIGAMAELQAAAGYHGLHDTNAVIERCTGAGDGGAGVGRRKPAAPSSNSSQHQQQQQQPGRGRGRGEPRAPATDVPLLRALLSRQAATMTDLVDVTSHRYDTALLVSLTPMQLSGVAAAQGTRAEASATLTMRALTERLTNTQFKQFGSQVVANQVSSTSSSSSPVVIETVALLHVPPFSAIDVPTTQQRPQQQRGMTQVHAAHEDSANGWDSTAGGPPGAAVTAATASSTGPSHVPTVMAARLEEWVLRRWPPSRKGPSKLVQVKTFTQNTSFAGASGEAAAGRKPQLGTPPPQMSSSASKSGAEGTTAAVGDGPEDDGPPPSALDRVAPVGGVATATQQALMRALLKHFSAATGAQLSEQMGLSIAPNYDVAEVGDAAAAMRVVAAKRLAPPPKKKR